MLGLERVPVGLPVDVVADTDQGPGQESSRCRTARPAGSSALAGGRLRLWQTPRRPGLTAPSVPPSEPGTFSSSRLPRHPAPLCSSAATPASVLIRRTHPVNNLRNRTWQHINDHQIRSDHAPIIASGDLAGILCRTHPGRSTPDGCRHANQPDWPGNRDDTPGMRHGCDPKLPYSDVAATPSYPGIGEPPRSSQTVTVCLSVRQGRLGSCLWVPGPGSGLPSRRRARLRS